MKILQLVKYYDPCLGGMETVVKNIVEGVVLKTEDINFTIYSNNDSVSLRKKIDSKTREYILKEVTPLIFKSQPLNIRYSSLNKLLNENEVIHHHYPFPTMEIALLRNLKLLKNKKLIITWHANIENSRWKYLAFFYTPIIRRLLNVSKKIVVTSPQLFENSKLLQSYSDKVEVIPLSFNPEVLSSTNSPRIFPHDRKFKLLFIGKLREYKGIKYLIEAISDLDVELSIVGKGEKEIELKQIAKDLNISNKINFFSGVTNSEISKFYKSSDLFVLPSINEAEAFGIVQLEAMSNALPIINTRLNSGVPFVSLDGISGLTVTPANSNDLKNAILKIITNKALYEMFSKNSLERSKEFTREQMASNYLKLYK